MLEKHLKTITFTKKTFTITWVTKRKRIYSRNIIVTDLTFTYRKIRIMLVTLPLTFTYRKMYNAYS